ncbi:MAG: aldo/keto reductase [Ktedonobacteraceae bacterium]|nr:aldo/keto reductase [Ktedonobacteraceae bacterium]
MDKLMRQLGATGIKVSPLGIGTNRWVYGKNDEAVSQAFHSYVDAGVNFFDTAEGYGFGKSERLLGECIKQNSRPVVIASKYMPLPMHQFRKALDGSLKRLGIQTIDLYYMHFPLTNIEKLMDQMAQAVQDGKIRAVGISNCNAAQMRRAAERLAHYNIPLAANEVQYNLLHRQPETNGVLDACRELNVALVAYFPLASGRLVVNSSSMRGNEALQTTLATIAQKRGKGVNQVALNWLLRRDEHVIPIPGATSARHAQENADALTWELSDEEFAAIDQASSPQK